jgi:hypothetical protein
MKVILYVLNWCDITLKFCVVAIFIVVAHFVCVLSPYQISQVWRQWSPVIAMKPKAKENFCTAAILKIKKCQQKVFSFPRSLYLVSVL